MIFGINTTCDISKLSQISRAVRRVKLRITISKYHSWYLCQISPQIMLLPILIFALLVISICDFRTFKTRIEASCFLHLTSLWISHILRLFSSLLKPSRFIIMGFVWSWPSSFTFIFQKRMHQIMTACFHCVRQKLHRRSGTFDLLGFDFLIDEDFKVC